MLKANVIRAIICVLIVAGFTFGVIKLFFLRFEAGDVYPAYSSLRSDPLGSRALYSSLENIDAAAVGRNFRPLQNLEFIENTAFFYIGTPVFDSDSVSADWLKTFEGLTHAGGRLILTFLPVEKKPANWRMSKCRQPVKKRIAEEHNRQKPAPGDSGKPAGQNAAENTSNSSAPPG